MPTGHLSLLEMYSSGLDHNQIHGSMDPQESVSQTASRSVQPFFAQYMCDSVTNTQTDTHTQTTLHVTSVVISRICAMHAMRPDI